MFPDQQLDFEWCYRAVTSRDSRFDGWFYLGVTSTGIYCRPSCPARTPLRHHVRFFRSAAAAQAAGFRACRRCRPDAVPGSPEWDVRADVVGRAMRWWTGRGCRGWPAGSGTPNDTSTDCWWPRWAPGRWRWRGPSGPTPPAC